MLKAGNLFGGNASEMMYYLPRHDIIVFSKTPEEHTERFRGVFEKLVAAGLRLKPYK